MNDGIKANVVTALGTAFDEAFALEVVIGLEGGAHGNVVFVGQCADGWKLVADAQGFGGNEGFEGSGDLEVFVVGCCEFHAFVVCCWWFVVGFTVLFLFLS